MLTRVFLNNLQSLNVKSGANSKLEHLFVETNPDLQCIQVDNKAAADAGLGSYGNWQKDTTATYSEDCESFLGVDDEILSSGLNLYPNPVSNTLSIDSKLPIEKVEIFNLLGQKELEANSDIDFISTDKLTEGIYFIKIYSDKGTTVRKLIKQ